MKHFTCPNISKIAVRCWFEFHYLPVWHDICKVIYYPEHIKNFKWGIPVLAHASMMHRDTVMNGNKVFYSYTQAYCWCFLWEDYSSWTRDYIFILKEFQGILGTFTYWECHLTVQFFCLCSSRTLDQLILKFQRLIVIVVFFGNGWHWSVMHIHIFLCSTVVTIVFSLFLWILLLGILLGIWLWLLGKTKFSNLTGHEVVKILPNYWSLSPMISF